MESNPYAPPLAGGLNEREYWRLVQRRAALAAAIDGLVYAAILAMVPVFVFGLALPSEGVFNPGWLYGVAGLFIYNGVTTWFGTSLGGLLTNTREARPGSLAGLLFITAFRSVWPLPFGVAGIIGAAYAMTLTFAAETGLRPDLSGIPFAVGPWVIPFFAWLFVRLRRETWQLSRTTLLKGPKE